MKILAWNIAHQIRQRPIPSDVPGLLESIGADVVLLNEYVEQRPRPEFRKALREHGYVHQEVSFTPGVHNQALAASLVPFAHGDLCPPTLGERVDGSAISNFLHIRLEDGLEVGVRAPAYAKRRDVLAYWGELAAIMESVADRPILFAGDINTNRFKKAGIEDAPGCRSRNARPSRSRIQQVSGAFATREGGGRRPASITCSIAQL